jgi:uncharacterized membrane protein SpoIIM required for sporulation
VREGKFLKRNSERWQSYLAETADPDEQADQFINIIDDLGFSKTYYPQSTTTKFLNGIAAKTYTAIYYNKKLKQNRILNFWLYEIPYLFGKYWKYYLFTFIVFSIIVALGVVSTIINPEFPAEFLGSGYVEMTEENIAKGDPFGVYKDMHPIPMFLYIMSNNVVVMLNAYIKGIFLGLGTLYALLTNGIMLGTFQTMFFTKGLGIESILVVWIHGALEINAIVLSGTGGLILGWSWLFPGTKSRLDAFKEGAKDSMKVMISLIPIIIMAAILESWVTRHTEMSLVASLFIIITSLLLIIIYYVIWPIIIRKRGITIINGEVVFPKAHEA